MRTAPRAAALLALALGAGCGATPEPAAGPAPSPAAVPASSRRLWTEPRVGDRVELLVEETTWEGQPVRTRARVSVEVVRVDAGLAWLRLGVRDEAGAPFPGPLGEDLLLPALARQARLPSDAPARDVVEAAGRRFDCRVDEADLAELGSAWHVARAADAPLYLVDGVVRGFEVESGARRTSYELLALREGQAPAGGALPADARALFEPGGWYVVEEDGQLVHRQLGCAGGVVFCGRVALRPVDGPGALLVGGASYAAPEALTWDALADDEVWSRFDAIDTCELLDLLAARAVQAARGEEGASPFLAWRERPVVAEGP